jgi:hypothetical protein
VIGLSGGNAKRVNTLTHEPRAIEDEDQPKGGVIKLVSSDFMSDGDLKQLLPHLGFSGLWAVKLTAIEPSAKLKYQLLEEEWKDGKAVRRRNLISTTSAFERLSFSIKDLDGDLLRESDEPRVVVRTWVVDGVGSSRGVLKAPQLTGIGFPQVKTLKGAVELPLKEEVAVWSYGRGKGTEVFKGDETIEALASRIEWCLMVKVRVIDASEEKAP